MSEIEGFEELDEEVLPESRYQEVLPRGYLSVSQVNQYMRCGEAYRRKYILGQDVAPRASMVLGRGVHKAAETLHKSIIAGNPASREETIQAYVDLFAAESKEMVLEKDEKEGVIKDSGVAMSACYHGVALGERKDQRTGEDVPAVKPVAAEQKFHVLLDIEDSDPVPFLGFIDLVEEDTVADLKTHTGSATSQAAADSSLQLTMYAHITGKANTRFDQILGPRKRVGARFVRTKSQRTSSDAKHALDIVKGVAEDISLGRFRKAIPDSWWCTKSWCSYWNDCRGKKT